MSLPTLFICTVCGYQRSLPFATVCLAFFPYQKSSLLFPLPGRDSNAFSGPHPPHCLWSKHNLLQEASVSSEGLQSSWHEQRG